MGEGRACITVSGACPTMKIALRPGNDSEGKERCQEFVRSLVTFDHGKIFPETGVEREGFL